MEEKRYRLRFTTLEDLVLLRSVLRENPYENQERWKVVKACLAEYSTKDFMLRSIKEHVDHLIKLYIKEDKINLKKSSTEEEYQEKQRLLQDVLNLRKEFKINKENTTKEKTITIREEPTAAIHVESVKLEEISIDEDCMDFIANSPSTSTSISSMLESRASSKRKSETPIKETTSFEYLMQRAVVDQEHKEKQMKLDEKKLELEERKIELERKRIDLENRKIAIKEETLQLEKQERIAKLEVEIKERKAFLKLMEQQQSVVSYLMSQVQTGK